MSWTQRFSGFQLPVFFLLAYIITWSAQIPAYIFAYNNGFSLTNEANLLHLINVFQGKLDSNFIFFYLLFTFSFGPTLAGVIVTALFYGEKGIKDLFKRLINYHISTKWYLLAIIIPLGLNLISLLLSYILSGFNPINYNFLIPISLSIPLLIYMVIFTGLAEEVGWRGYALPELLKNYSAENASWILGIAWGLWHIPSNLMIPFLSGTLTIPFVIMIVLALTFGTVGWTIVLTWFYNNTNSLMLIIVIHGLMNTLQSYFILSSDSYTANIVFAILPWAVAHYLLTKYGPQTLLIKKNK